MGTWDWLVFIQQLSFIISVQHILVFFNFIQQLSSPSFENFGYTFHDFSEFVLQVVLTSAGVAAIVPGCFQEREPCVFDDSS